jgi:RNA 3'-terminal phosphate cyclase (ATP)
MITIDGSFGEGGGQILRSSLAMSLVTGKPFAIHRIRAGRKNPGLMRQHLTAVSAAKAVGQAEVTGDSVSSQELTFVPKTIRPGSYHFAVGTAGSTTLVLQTILPALMIAEGPSTIVLEGGTHNPFAPPFSFLESVFVPLVNRMGPKIGLSLQRAGFYPAGGGRFEVTIEPATRLQPLDILDSGRMIRKHARIYLANLPGTIGKREGAVIREKLGWEEDQIELIEVRQSPGPGNLVSLEVQSEAITESFTGFGMKGVPAEQVPMPAIEELRDYLAAGVPVGLHLADQLMIPMALAGTGRYRTLAPSRHSTTNMDVIRQFLDVKIEAVKIDPSVYEIEIKR